MAKKTVLDRKIREKVLKFTQLLNKENIKTEKIILYGSWAKGTAKNYSDIDLCLVSKSFAKNPDFYFKKIWHLAAQIDPSLEPIPFTPTELNNPYSTLSAEINRYGLLIN